MGLDYSITTSNLPLKTEGVLPLTNIPLEDIMSLVPKTLITSHSKEMPYSTAPLSFHIILSDSYHKILSQYHSPKCQAIEGY